MSNFIGKCVAAWFTYEAIKNRNKPRLRKRDAMLIRGAARILLAPVYEPMPQDWRDLGFTWTPRKDDNSAN